MNIRDLEYLVALAEYRHFQRAAEACNVSQPTLSTQLRKLENELGLLLLERTTRKVHFTQIGLQLVEQTRTVLREISVLKNIAHTGQKSTADTLNIGIIPTLAPYLFDQIHAYFSESFPKMQLEIYEADAERLVSMLKSEEIECAIVADSYNLENYVELPLFEEPLVLGVHPDHPFARLDEISMEQLKDSTMLMLDKNNGLHDQILKYFYKHDIKQDKRFVAMHLETLRRGVSCNRGIALFPLLATRGENQSQIKYIRCVNPVPARKVVMLFRRGDSMRKSYEAFRRMMAIFITDYNGTLNPVL
ncbi:DNA-binding transcriptional regulator OxyR [Pantoea sp. B65]|uniref:DNA-binding transcriptional regulator OxyR n=1 Tax=Pantoea sp. B65 TaxID=2813359 RepID=UPI0039B5FF0B